MTCSDTSAKSDRNSMEFIEVHLGHCWNRRSPFDRRILDACSGKIWARTICDTCGTRSSCPRSASACGRADSTDRRTLCRNARTRKVSRPCDFSGVLGVATVWRTSCHRHRNCVLVYGSARASPRLACLRMLCHSGCISSPIASRYYDGFVCVVTSLTKSRTVYLEAENCYCERWRDGADLLFGFKWILFFKRHILCKTNPCLWSYKNLCS